MIIWLSPANSQCEFAPNSQYCEFQAEFGANSRCERIRSEFGEFKLNSLRICIPTPDTRRPSQRWQATPPGDGPPPAPRHAAPTGHAGQGDSVGPPHPHTRAHSMWVADPKSPPSGRAVGGGTAPDLRRPTQWWKAPPLGTPFSQPHSEQRRPARAHAVGPVPAPHARTERTRDTRVAEPRLPAPEDGRPGEGQRLTPDAPHNGAGHPPRGRPPHQPRGTQPPQGMQAKGTVLGPDGHTPAPTARGWRTPTARPVGGPSGEGQRLTSDAPHNGRRHAPRGRPSATCPVGAACCGGGGGPSPGGLPATVVRGVWCQALSLPRPPVLWSGQPGFRDPCVPGAVIVGVGTQHRPHSVRPCRPALLAVGARQGDSVGPLHPHTRAHSTWVADPNSPPSGRAVGGGTAPAGSASTTQSPYMGHPHICVLCKVKGPVHPR